MVGPLPIGTGRPGPVGQRRQRRRGVRYPARPRRLGGGHDGQRLRSGHKQRPHPEVPVRGVEALFKSSYGAPRVSRCSVKAAAVRQEQGNGWEAVHRPAAERISLLQRASIGENKRGSLASPPKRPFATACATTDHISRMGYLAMLVYS